MSDIHIHIDRETPVKVITLEPNGARGAAATVSVGATTTGNAGTNASVTNSGTSSAAVFNFTIPRGDTGAAGPNSVTSATTSDGTADLSVRSMIIESDSGGALEVTAINDAAFTARSLGDAAAVSASAQETCADFLSQNESAIHVRSNLGAYTIKSFNGAFNECAIERVRGWFVWFYNTFTGRLKTADITDDREWTLPNASGTIALTSDLAPLVINASATATAGRQHINVATATYTDPTPSEGAWFRVIVRNGDATVGGTAYATSGTVIERSYHSGAWANRVYNETPVLAANVATFLQTPSSANLAAAVTDETGTGSLCFATSPTIVTPTIQQINVGSGQCLVTGTGASGILQLRATSTAGFSSCDLQNTSGTQVGGFGYGGTTAGAYTDQCYFYGTNRVLVLASQITQRHLIIDLSGRIGIGNGISTVNAAAQLQVDSTTRGFLPPRMTTAQRDAITSVPAGLMIYNTSTNKLNFYNGSAWEAVTSA